MVCAQSDRIELRSGITLTGSVVEITDSSVIVEMQAGTRTLKRTYPIKRVKAVTVNGERRTFDAPKENKTTAAPSEQPASIAAIGSGALIERTPQEVTNLINQLGRTPPTWFDQTTLDFPNTLDLTWPDTKPPSWNYTRHVEHYIWDIINSNRNRYGNGVRFMHHLLNENRARPQTLPKVMNELGRMYFEFFNDYGRAAFWWQQAKVTENPRFTKTDSPARLAECYWKLGNRAMAEATLSKTPLTYGVIKLWGDLMETDRAIRLVQEAKSAGLEASELFVLAGDALRTAKRYDEAIPYYRQAIALEASGPLQEQITRNQRRAQETIELIELFDKLQFTNVASGVYEDLSYGYAGNVELKTEVEDGVLQRIQITSLSDKQYFHAVDATIKKILKQQTVQGIDAVSGATVTSEAVIRATAKAMAQGTR